MKYVYRVMLPGLNPRNGMPIFVDFETDYPAMDTFVADLNLGEIILGEKLFTRRAPESGILEITRRQPFALRREGIGRIELPPCRFVEYIDEAEPAPGVDGQ